ncbi:methylthioribose kinase [Enterococcus florum]|uniref:S-methyl-5-thioribose kinase n=1 Tax=Enterococcus florum TaxID=2480627 RepID=A0A4P5PD79_9ENTE|nr:S-methyl-5-thioribose kinase [Enterococcus florum]GCF95866.1 methylthioribose kinase [Enterococcus florum]
MHATPAHLPKYQHHFLMQQADIKEYATQELRLFPLDATLLVTEIGDGNINYVFRIEEQETGRSVVIKQADTLLRSSGRPLSIDRSRIEAEILRWQNELAPVYVPKVIHFDPIMYALTMEDIFDYQNMRYQLIEKQVFPNFSQEISSYLTEVLLPTSDLILDRALKKQKVRQFVNIEMSDISEDLVFTEPYDDYKKRNVLTIGNEAFVHQQLYENNRLQTEVAWLRDRFMNQAQALIHGDLHTGSLFINTSGLKVIDPEFAFYGPIGYDIGNVLAHLYFPLVKNRLDGSFDKAFNDWLLHTIKEVYDHTYEKFTALYDQQVQLPLYQNLAFKKEWLAAVFADAVGYAGTEIIRRVVGDSKVKELSLLEDHSKQLQMERILIQTGMQLILKRQEITRGQQLIELFYQAEEL